MTTPAPLGARDAELLRFIAEHRGVLPAQLAVLSGLSPATVARRVRGLERAGLVRHQPILSGHPAVRCITAAGLRRLGRPARISADRGFKPREAMHDLAAGWLWLAAREGAFGALRALHTERALRSADGIGATAGPGQRGVRLFELGARGAISLHYPDLELETAAGQRVALELELTRKPDRDLERILSRYAADPRFAAVVYLVADDTVEASVRRAAERAGATEKLVIRRFTFSAQMRSLATGLGHQSARASAHRQRSATARTRGPAPEAGR